MTVTRLRRHRGGIRSVVTNNRGELCFVLCRCGWRSHLWAAPEPAWMEHDVHERIAADPDVERLRRLRDVIEQAQR